MKIGKETLFLKIDDNVRRNGEGSFIRLSDGRIMYAYTEFYSGASDESRADIVAVFSSDEGESWNDKRTLIKSDESAGNYMSVSLIKLKNSDIGMMYLRKSKDCLNCIPHFVTSSDDGKSWSLPTVCIEKQGYYVVCNDRALRLENSDIVVPVNLHHLTTDNSGFVGGKISPKGNMNFLISSNEGKTWRLLLEEYISLSCESGLQETVIYQHENGSLTAFSRTSLGYQYECTADSEKAKWNLPRPSTFFTSPTSPMQIKKFGKYTVAVFNPIPLYTTRDCHENWGRSPLICAISVDDAKTFTKVFYLEDDPENDYCYPSIFEAKDGILFAYYHSDGGKNWVLASNVIKKIYFTEIE